jgi:hypothetical protein
VILLELRIERVGGEVYVNGRPIHRSDVQVVMDENAYSEMPLNQQWAMLCQLNKVTAVLNDVYARMRAILKDMPATTYERMLRTRSGAAGLAGVLTALPQGKHLKPPL